MAKGRKGGKRKKGGGPSVPAKGPQLDAQLADQVEAVRADLVDPAAWGSLQKLLLRSTLDASEVAAVVMRRDLGALDAMVSRLRGETPSTQGAEAGGSQADSQTQDALNPVDEQVLRDAMKAFRRRLKLTKLDHESRLGRSPLSTGKGADFESILPPRQFDDGVWAQLAARGELTATGRGFYALPKPPPALRGGG
ncbi:MAG: hypothetical protein MK101_03355 [Phycisphaerales bacterium]|nr:hypothetical protein [Phycisphaerales bacterium]